MSVAPKKKYAELSWGEVVTLTTTLLQLPVVVLWSLAISPFVSYNKSKTTKRVIVDSAFRFFSSSLSITQLQYSLGTDRSVYETWVKQNNLPVVVEELGEDARLFWMGPKRTDRVILYFHGGAYLVPLQDFAASFWRYVQLQLGKRKIEVGFAILSYSLAPNGPFPIQLRQAKLALEHLLATGVHPQNIQIVGDSAGAGLILQLLSHILHPNDTVPPLFLPSRIGGCYLMSPWVSLTGDTGSHTVNDKSDIISAKNLTKWGRTFLVDIPESQNAYVEAVKAPEEWFKGADGVFERVLITAGAAECLRDDIVQFADVFTKHHPDVKVVVQKGGVHNDPYWDFCVNESKLGELTPLIVKWLAEGLD